MSCNRKNTSLSPAKKNKNYPSDPLIKGLTKVRNYYYSLDFATGGLLKYLTLL